MTNFDYSKYLSLFGAGVGVLLVLCVGPVGCGSAEADDDRPTVVATTTMIEDLVRVIGGDEVNVVGIMKSGQDPHIYDVKPKDAQRIRQADLVLYNGLHLEATLLSIIEEHAGDKSSALAKQEGIEPLTGSVGLEVAADPHCWMDVKQYQLYAKKAAEALAEMDPDNAPLYRERAEAYIEQLEELDAWVREQFASVPERRRVIVTGHDAFAYYGRAYGIEVHGLIGISTEQEPRPQDIEALKTLIRERGVRAIFPESSISGSLKQLVQGVAQDTGAQVGDELYSDSLGAPDTDASTYIGMIRHNTQTMVEALK